MKNRKIQAFTLIELVVVILILGILAALIVPKVIGRSAEAKVAKAQADLKTLSEQLQIFHMHCDRYPTTEEGLQALRVQPADVTGWKGPYLPRDVPKDPWGNDYVYESPGSNGNDSYNLLSYGSDGAPGGEGDAADLQAGD